MAVCSKAHCRSRFLLKMGQMFGVSFPFNVAVVFSIVFRKHKQFVLLLTIKLPTKNWYSIFRKFKPSSKTLSNLWQEHPMQFCISNVETSSSIPEYFRYYDEDIYKHGSISVPFKISFNDELIITIDLNYDDREYIIEKLPIINIQGVMLYLSVQRLKLKNAKIPTQLLTFEFVTIRSNEIDRQMATIVSMDEINRAVRYNGLTVIMDYFNPTAVLTHED
ncbi:hypothetical protein ROZALSC1DRAFT_21598 [Rozella allomycis CSF55]|uniref:Uncharacterized protein n=1 Tax=Rozella allomycis (strain CSF55) TaxID=988480 RepID=A0A4V1J038_ROZAC|nr:hypothetical protein ROZALSC1DRAFT_21598 [Rozella allomycis CSF55]